MNNIESALATIDTNELTRVSGAATHDYLAYGQGKVSESQDGSRLTRFNTGGKVVGRYHEVFNGDNSAWFSKRAGSCYTSDHLSMLCLGKKTGKPVEFWNVQE